MMDISTRRNTIKQAIAEQFRRQNGGWYMEDVMTAMDFVADCMADMALHGVNVVFYGSSETNQIKAHTDFGDGTIYPGGSIMYTAIPRGKDGFNEWIGKAVCLAKLMGRPVPEFIMKHGRGKNG